MLSLRTGLNVNSLKESALTLAYSVVPQHFQVALRASDSIFPKEVTEKSFFNLKSIVRF